MNGHTLYAAHGSALATLYAEVENYARGTAAVFVGTAGSVLERRNAQGFRFYARQYYDGGGKKREQYLAGPVGDPAAERLAAETRKHIAELKQVVPHLRLLGREGYNLVDPKTYATLASLSNGGLFRAGAVLIGSHAYGALLNQLGARAIPYATHDVDIARATPLAFPNVPDKSFLETLRGSGIDFVEIPELDRRKPGTSFKEPGRSFFQVDLLVPSRTSRIHTVPVPELKAHATALPYLAYLLGECQDSVVLAREGCCLLRVPVPERFALHKLIVSQSRSGRAQKSGKDISQASVLLAILSERHPGSIEAAAEHLPKSARRLVRTAAALARQQLRAHPRAIETLDEINL
jgi:hypothetical protein